MRAIEVCQRPSCGDDSSEAQTTPPENSDVYHFNDLWFP